MKPSIAIVIPCFNQAHFLEEALGSLVRQTRPDWEAIVVDDGSTSGDCRAALAQIGDERVRLIRHEVNRGLAAARNTGVRATRADLIMPLDADDRLAESFVDEVLLAFDDPRIHYVFTDVRRFGLDDAIWHYRPFEAAEIGRRQTVLGCMPFHVDVWKAVGGFCEDPMLRAGNEDWDFWMGVVAHGFVGLHIPKPLYDYRATQRSMYVKLRPTLWQTHEFIAARHRSFLQHQGVLETFLSYGYRTSALAAYYQGDYREAVRLAARAVSLGATEPPLRRLARLRALPDCTVQAAVRTLVALWSGLRRLLPGPVRQYLAHALRSL